jgi:tol-pal system protein YbgF
VAYDEALAAFQAGQLKKADAGFTGFVRKYNASPYLPLALYWLGNTKYALKEYPGAITQLQVLIKTYPKHPRIPAAMLTLGNCQLESGNKTAARKTYGDLIANYPDTEVAVEARQMLPRTK